MYDVRAVAMVASLALQTVVVPKIYAIQTIARRGGGRSDAGEGGNEKGKVEWVELDQGFVECVCVWSRLGRDQFLK